MLRRPARLAALALATAALGVGAAAPAAQASSGALDVGFGLKGFTNLLLGTKTGAVASVEQSNGDIVTAGAAIVSGTSEMLVTRLLPNGTPDSSFGSGGSVLVPIGKNAYADAIALQSDGKIVVAGTGRSTVTGTPLGLAAVRLTTGGQLDPSFGSGGIAVVPVGSNAVANAVAIQPNGEILLGGTATSGANQFVAARLTSAGAPDASFGSGGVEAFGPTAAAWGMALQPNGDVVLAGQETYKGTQAYMAARLLPNGQPDTSFGQARTGIVTVPIGSTAAGMAVGLQSTGDIVITGNATSGTRVIATVALLPNGSLDPSFGTGGIASVNGSGVNALAIEPNDEIVLAGSGPSAIKLTSSGALDATFGKQGIAFATYGLRGSANGVTIETNGELVLTGATQLSGAIRMVVARLEP
jgi:uncharacterized delta-60 repeat protein